MLTNRFDRYPMTVRHEICEGSPLANWSAREGKRMDACAEIMIVAKVCARRELGYMCRDHDRWGREKRCAWRGGYVTSTVQSGRTGGLEIPMR